jgi:N utilization substance protein A
VALDDLEREKKIKKEVFLEALELALVSAYKRNFGEGKAIEVRLIPERNTIRVVAYKTVAEEVLDPEREISVEDAQLIKKSYKAGDIVPEEVTPKEFGRIAAQTAKQVIMQRLREAEGEMAYDEVSKKEDQLVTGIIRRIEGGSVYVDIGKLEAVMLPQDQSPGEKYNLNESIKVYVKKVRQGTHGPQILVSRSSPSFVRRLFEMEVPEVAAGIVSIRNIVREAGFRTKLSVSSDDTAVDPVGACVGNRGVRVNTVVAELNGEKIDIIPWCSDALEFIARSLSPAKVIMVEVNDEEKTAKVIVPDDKLSLAIGRGGQNARLAARLTGWRIDVKSYTASLQTVVTAGETEETEVVRLDLENDIFRDIGDIGGAEDIGANTFQVNAFQANTFQVNTDPVNTELANAYADTANALQADTDPVNTDPADTDLPDIESADLPDTFQVNTFQADTAPADTDPLNADTAGGGDSE